MLYCNFYDLDGNCDVSVIKSELLEKDMYLVSLKDFNYILDEPLPPHVDEDDAWAVHDRTEEVNRILSHASIEPRDIESFPYTKIIHGAQQTLGYLKELKAAGYNVPPWVEDQLAEELVG